MISKKQLPIIILVDNDEMDLELNRISILQSGLEVHIESFSSPNKAIEFTRRCHINLTPPALIITDLQMPIMDGLEMVRFLEESGLKTFPAVVMSASSLHEDVFIARQAGVDGYYEKPIDLTSSIKLFTRILQDHVNWSLRASAA